MQDLARPIGGALAVVMRDRTVLLVQRRNPPDAGLWGYPGGKIELGETIRDAALRELHEETGIIAGARSLLTPFDVLRHDAQGALLAHFILIPVLCDWLDGSARAATDALDVGWFALDELERHGAMLCQHVAELAHEAVTRMLL